MIKNEAGWDRSLRVTVGGAMLAAGLWNLAPEPWDTGLEILALVPLLTGLSGWCPIYALIGRGTCRPRG